MMSFAITGSIFGEHFVCPSRERDYWMMKLLSVNWELLKTVCLRLLSLHLTRAIIGPLGDVGITLDLLQESPPANQNVRATFY